jgi:uncharacterized membrane protein YeaQ/YmgE (transglycosylase-associated protein family)
MTAEALLIWLIIGAVAGFLAGVIVKGYGFGLVGNIVIGIVGAFLASLLLPRIGLFTGADVVGQIIAATIGAVILLVLVGVLRRA